VVTQVTSQDGMIQVYIPAGAFTMGGDVDQALAECQKMAVGCQRDWFTNEAPAHVVTLDAFWMDHTEVSNSQYALCVQAGACQPPIQLGAFGLASYYGNPEYAHYPVIYVTWEQANAYCAWVGRRLPTEAEWEKAARGGLEDQQYPWGNAFDDVQANFCDQSCVWDWANPSYNDKYLAAAPAGSYDPNGYGVHEMAGNVWEWVNDRYSPVYYEASPDVNPQGLDKGGYRVLRGGSWSTVGYNLRVALRSFKEPTQAGNDIGFRCAASVP
jgi:serine/threonine-protein kinase